MTHQQQMLFDDSYSYGIVNGTTIPLRTGPNRQGYITALNVDITENFGLTFALLMAAEAYSSIRSDIENYLKHNDH